MEANHKSMDELTAEIIQKILDFPEEKLFYKLKIFSKRGSMRGRITTVGSAYFKALEVILSMYDVGIRTFTAPMVHYFIAAEAGVKNNIWGAMHRMGDNHILVLLRQAGILTWTLNPAFLNEYYGEPKTSDL